MRARIRSIKPEIFSDEKLWDLGSETGLPVMQAFAGLWCHADREGRFEWRPRALKAGILPYWDGDFGAVMDALEAKRFIVRYVVDGRVCGFVRNFDKHQVVNHREEQSRLPPPPVDDACLTREPPVNGAGTALPVGKGTEGNGREREGKGADAPAREASVPRSAQGQKTVWHNLDGWEIPEEVYTEAAIVGLPRDRLEFRIGKLREGPIGGTRGVFNRTNHVKGLIGTWRAWDENDAAKRLGAKRATADPNDRLQRQADRIQMLEEQESKGARETV